MELSKGSHLNVLLVVVTCLSIGGCVRVSLSRVSTLYLPTYSEDGVTYSFDTATVEQLAFDPQSKLIYAVGTGILHIVDASNVNRLKLVHHVRMPHLDLTDVEVCGQAVFVSYVNTSHGLHGGVFVYRGYSAWDKQLQVLHDLEMGPLPDMVYPTGDCTILVAMENEGVIVDGRFHDPPGRVGIIRFPYGVEAQPIIKILDFTKFDNQFDRLSKSGVRWVYRYTSFSNNIEPEYITYNQDYSKAYICLQENNAIAVVDLTTDTITDIYGLGFKPWGELDPSDRDGGIHIRDWPIYGMYLPDAIRWVRWNGEEYIITANEGDSQVYEGDINFDESIRGSEIPVSDLADSMSEELKQALADDTKLGRLVLSNVDGRNAEGKLEKLYTYGGRSFSVWRVSDMSQVYDSGSQLARLTRNFRPNLFNNNPEAEVTVAAAMDKRSDSKGVEPEALATAELENHLLIFVGLERPGTIAVYSVAPSAGFSLQFQQLYTEGIPRNREGDTYQQIYDDRQLYGVSLEYLKYFSSGDGLADFPALLVGGAASGTISILRVNVEQPPLPSLFLNPLPPLYLPPPPLTVPLRSPLPAPRLPFSIPYLRLLSSAKKRKFFD